MLDKDKVRELQATLDDIEKLKQSLMTRIRNQADKICDDAWVDDVCCGTVKLAELVSYANKLSRELGLSEP